MSVESLPEVGSYLCTLTLHRRANGEIHMNVTDMPPGYLRTTRRL